MEAHCKVSRKIVSEWSFTVVISYGCHRDGQTNKIALEKAPRDSRSSFFKLIGTYLRTMEGPNHKASQTIS